MNGRKRAVLVIDEAAGKRIKALSLAEPYPESHDIYLSLEFEDGTEILIEVGCSISFGITPLSADDHGDLMPSGKRRQGSVPTLAKREQRAKERSQQIGIGGA